LAVYANLATFYCIGMPVACVLGFKLKLYVKVLSKKCNKAGACTNFYEF